MTGQQRPRHGLFRLAVRFVFGHHLDGRPRGDSSFFGRAVEAEPHWLWRDGSPWVRAAGWHRAAVRLVVVGALVGLWRARHTTEWAFILAGGPALGLVAWLAWLRVGSWRLRRELVRPLSSALAPFLGVPPGAVERTLSVRPDFEDADQGEHVGDLGLPDHWAATGDQRARVEEVIGARFGVDLRFGWQTARYPMVVNFTRAPVPPTMVRLAEVLAELDARPAHKILLGKAADGALHFWDRSAEDPMLAVHGGSRRGKTSLLLAIAAQELATGGRVTAIDPKWVSLQALAGIPGVTLLNDPRDIHAMWAGVAEYHETIQERFEALSHDPTLEFSNELLVIDEVSMFASITQQTWRAEKDKSDPALAPVWDDLAGCVWLGAQVDARVVVAGQRLDYKILGGMLGSFGVRMLAGYGPQDYARLVGVPPFLRSQKPRGRFLLFEGGELTWLQLVFGDPGEWRDYALSRVLAGREGASDLAATCPPGTPGQGELVGLDAAAAHLGMQTEAFRKARQRRPVDGERQAPDGRPAWSPEALTAWRGARPSAATGARP
jgi:hypothetical protein